jgi:tRNA nucleotidyltransferase (CCA-adding enzyme)
VKTVITTHKNMDLDALGAVVGVKKLYPQATVVLPDTKGQEVVKLLEENPELLEFVNESSFIGEVEKLIVVDTDSIERIPESVRRAVTPKTQVVVFDHHSGGFSLPEVELHHKGSGAVSSVIALILKGKGITPSPYEASVMLAGIYSDTGSFRYPSTTPIDFLAAAYLMAVGGEVEFVKKYLPKELSEREIDLLKLLKDT